eukprot:4692175-Alexandrium_andersonii.AAC.1
MAMASEPIGFSLDGHACTHTYNIQNSNARARALACAARSWPGMHLAAYLATCTPAPLRT